MTNNITLLFRSAPLALCEVLLKALFEANAIDGYHARQQGGSFGAIAEALKKTLWCEIRTLSTTLTPDEVTAIANLLFDEALSNGENIDYQIHLWNKELITL